MKIQMIPLALAMIGLVACHKNTYIVTTPPGATVSDPKTKAVWGTTPLELDKPAGSYRIKIELKDFAPEIVEFDIKGGKNSAREKLGSLKLVNLLAKRKTKEYWSDQVFYLSGLPAWTYRLKLQADGSISYQIKDSGMTGAWVPGWGFWVLGEDAVRISKVSYDKSKQTYVFKLHGNPEDKFAYTHSVVYGPYFRDTSYLKLYR